MKKIKSSFLAAVLCAMTTVLAQATLTLPTRYYDATQGRFISADTIVPDAKDPQSLNRYAYVRNNPMILTDPTGHSWLSKTINRVNSWADKNPWGAFAVQQFNLLAGTALLSRTETGRTIVAGEVILASAYITGVGMVPANLGWGAVGGEMMGAYSARKSGGSILTGLVVGGVVGGAAGYYGFQGEKAIIARNPTAWGVIKGEMFRGGMLGASRGFAWSFKGGEGNFKDMVTDTLTSAASAAVINGAFAYVRLAALQGNGIGYPNGIPTGTPPLRETGNLNMGGNANFQAAFTPNLAGNGAQNIAWPNSQNAAAFNLSSQNVFPKRGFDPSQIDDLME